MIARSHAVVIGASFAGLLAAAALSETFDAVTVYDRDTLPDGPLARRGVPQSRQAHALAAGGADALAELLPGFREDMIAAGGVVADLQRDVHWYLDGYLVKPAESGLTGISMTRPAIEDLVRRRVTALDGVTVTGGTEVTGLLAEGGRVTGVTAGPARTGAAASRDVDADLVVDAGGRGSRAPAWLEDLGYPVPGRSRVRSRVTYVTRYYTADPGQLGGRGAVMITAHPGNLRGGAVIRQEGGRFVLMWSGMTGEEPPLDDQGLLEYAETLDCRDMAEVLRVSEPLGDAVKMRYPESTWRHYEKLGRYLDGFLVTGDALCSFNPVYGQGITVAAREALELRRLLRTGHAAAGLPRRYFKAAARVIADAWATSACGDLRFPGADGSRQRAGKLVNAYLDRYRAAASVDAELGAAFLRVANMVDPPARLLAPGRVARVFRLAGQGRAAFPAAAPGGGDGQREPVS